MSPGGQDWWKHDPCNTAPQCPAPTNLSGGCLTNTSHTPTTPTITNSTASSTTTTTTTATTTHTTTTTTAYTTSTKTTTTPLTFSTTTAYTTSSKTTTTTLTTTWPPAAQLTRDVAPLELLPRLPSTLWIHPDPDHAGVVD